MTSSPVNLRPLNLLSFVLLTAALLWFWRGRAHAQTAPAPAAPPATPPAALELTGPFTHENLTVFLVHDRKAQVGEDVLTLEEALDSGVVRLEETGEVNRLLVSNKGKAPVYLQAGDVVKGGRQDRTLQYDTLLAPRATKVAVAAFCVEAGRWHARGGESAQRFASSKATLVTRKQKLAAKAAASQAAVWSSVAEAQDSLAANLGRSVKSAVSETSLQLSLENGEVGSAADRYVKALEPKLAIRPDTVGFAFAVNGKVSAVDLYASPALFRKMRSKLVRASAMEAVAEKGASATPAVSADAVRALLVDAESGAARTELRSARTHVQRKETKASVVFTAEDPADAQKAVHKSYLRK
jgi:hypothetical protein